MSNQDPSNDFMRQAETKAPSLPAEFYDFMMSHKKWWLAPIAIVLFLLGVLLLVGSTGAAPFIYTLF